MDDRDRLLVDNLKESLRLAQNYMVLSFSSAASAFSLVLLNPGKIQVARDLVPLEVPARSAAAILVALYWVFGMLAGYSVARVKRILDLLDPRKEIVEKELDGKKEIVEKEILDKLDKLDKKDIVAKRRIVQAVLTYPSVPTIRMHLPRLFLCVASPALAVSCVVKLFGTALLSIFPLLGILLLLLPHAVLISELRRAIGGETPGAYSD